MAVDRRDEDTGRDKPSVLVPDLAVTRIPESPTAKAYRSVRASIRHARTESPIRTVLIAEAGAGDQRGEAAANIAASFALNGEPTVLVDADSERPVQNGLLNTRLSPGLVEWLLAGSSIERPEPVETAVDNLSVLPAGSTTALGTRSGADLLSADGCAELIDTLSGKYRFVLFHAPELPGSSEALTVAAQVDAVLLVVRSGVTKRTDAQRGREALERVGANILGAVLTDTR